MERNYGHNKGNSYLNNYLSKKSRTSRNTRNIDKKTIEKLYWQFIASSVICLILIVISNFNSPFIKRMVGDVKWVISADYDFKDAVYSFRDNVLPVINGKFKDISDSAPNTNNNDNGGDIPAANKAIMAMPLMGEVTSEFGDREDPITHQKAYHYGMDISGEKGTPIKCPLDGVVVKIDTNNTMGRSVRIMHSGGLETVYGHCSEILVSENQQVRQGEYIAKVGDTGAVTAPHLHFEVLKDGKHIDPRSILEGIIEPK